MKNLQGFSLTEVLVSLLLITTTSIALLRHHLQLSQQVKQLVMNARTSLETENQYELEFVSK